MLEGPGPPSEEAVIEVHGVKDVPGNSIEGDALELASTSDSDGPTVFGPMLGFDGPAPGDDKAMKGHSVEGASDIEFDGPAPFENEARVEVEGHGTAGMPGIGKAIDESDCWRSPRCPAAFSSGSTTSKIGVGGLRCGRIGRSGMPIGSSSAWSSIGATAAFAFGLSPGTPGVGG